MIPNTNHNYGVIFPPHHYNDQQQYNAYTNRPENIPPHNIGAPTAYPQQCLLNPQYQNVVPNKAPMGPMQPYALNLQQQPYFSQPTAPYVNQQNIYTAADPGHVQVPINPGGNGLSYTSHKGFDDIIDTSIRHAFVRKVFGIVLCQLLITFILMFFFIMVPPLGIFIVKSTWILIVACIATFGIMIALSCSTKMRRAHPMNMILFTFMSIGYSFILTYMAYRLSVIGLTLATLATCLLVFCLILFATQTRYDFTGMGPYLMIGGIILLGFGIATIFIKSKIASLIYFTAGIGLVSFYLIYDCQLIIGGKKHQNEISIDDYLVGALMLYTDIVTLYMYILGAVSMLDSDS